MLRNFFCGGGSGARLASVCVPAESIYVQVDSQIYVSAGEDEGVGLLVAVFDYDGVLELFEIAECIAFELS